MPHESTDSDVIISGFQDIRDEVTNPNGKLHWYCAPDSWQIVASPEEDQQQHQREGRDGSWRLVLQKEHGAWLELKPPAKKDFWRKTYYTPILIKDDGPALYYSLSTSTTSTTTSSNNQLEYGNFYTVTTSFTLTAYRQFDQAGLYLRLDAEHWIKAGIEVVDGIPRLSTVVCNVYSDWATQEWPYTIRHQQPLKTPLSTTSAMADTSCDDDADAPVDTTGGVQTSARIRLHCRGISFVVEAEFPGKGWQFVRIAYLSTAVQCQDDPLQNNTAWQGPVPEPGTMWVGVFACSPEDQQGGTAVFSEFTITKGSHVEHNADGNSELTSIASF